MRTRIWPCKRRNWTSARTNTETDGTKWCHIRLLATTISMTTQISLTQANKYEEEIWPMCSFSSLSVWLSNWQFHFLWRNALQRIRIYFHVLFHLTMHKYTHILQHFNFHFIFFLRLHRWRCAVAVVLLCNRHNRFAKVIFLVLHTKSASLKSHGEDKVDISNGTKHKNKGKKKLAQFPETICFSLCCCWFCWLYVVFFSLYFRSNERDYNLPNCNILPSHCLFSQHIFHFNRTNESLIIKNDLAIDWRRQLSTTNQLRMRNVSTTSQE